MHSVNTVVLTSRENFVWHSMQEIIPAIERAWQRSAIPGVHEVKCIDIDNTRFTELLPALMCADNIVQTCFTHKMCRLGSLIRESFHLDSRFIIHLHSQATIGCWPFHAWGMGKLLTEEDIFVSSCERDARTMSLSFTNGFTVVVPFSNPEQEAANRNASAPTEVTPVPLVFVGRISAQKNLHTLLHAFSLILEKEPSIPARLELFGKEDHLGSPNMGFGSTDYGERLRAIAAELRLGGHVSFRGHVSRNELYESLSGRAHVFVSASLHSDENFGMAAFRSLCGGNTALLSDWGGHADFESRFPDRVTLVPVRHSDEGPFICPRDLALGLLAAIKTYFGTRMPLFPDAYRESHVSNELAKLALSRRGRKEPLLLSDAARRILVNRETHASQNARSTRIFEGYRDPLAHSFFRAYGAREMAPAEFGINQSFFLVPWAQVNGSEIFCDDPHRGQFKVSLEMPNNGSHALIDRRGTRHLVTEKDAVRALELGVIHV